MPASERVVYAASSSAYGNRNPLPQVETMLPGPLSPYAVQKLLGELYLRSYWEVYGLETVALRYFNIFGPRQAPDSPYSGVMAKFAKMMLEGEQPTIHGDGEQSRDFTYVENVVQANLKAAAAPAEKVAGRIFNCACGQPYTLNQTYKLIAELTGYKNPPKYGPPQRRRHQALLCGYLGGAGNVGIRPENWFSGGVAADGGMVSRAAPGPIAEGSRRESVIQGVKAARAWVHWQRAQTRRRRRVKVEGLCSEVEGLCRLVEGLCRLIEGLCRLIEGLCSVLFAASTLTASR